MPRIIQISAGADTSEHDIYGLGDDGKLYYWGRKRFSYTKDDEGVTEADGKFYDSDGNTYYYKLGWKELVDELNK